MNDDNKWIDEGYLDITSDSWPKMESGSMSIGGGSGNIHGWGDGVNNGFTGG